MSKCIKDPTISIVIPCYNQERFLDKCLSSLINQTYKHLEIIIVNDGSTDSSEKIIDSYIELSKSSETLRIIKINQENKGLGGAINTGLKFISGDLFCWQDCDDFYERDALEKLKKYLDENPNYDFVRGEVAFRHEENMNSIAYIGKSKYPQKTNIFKNVLFHKDMYCYPGCFLIRSVFFTQCVPYREIYPSKRGQDWQLLLPVSYYGKCGYLNSVVFNYVIRKNSMSHKKQTTKTKLQIYDEFIRIINKTLNNISMPYTLKTWLQIRIIVKYRKKQISSMLRFLFSCFFVERLFR